LDWQQGIVTPANRIASDTDVITMNAWTHGVVAAGLILPGLMPAAAAQAGTTLPPPAPMSQSTFKALRARDPDLLRGLTAPRPIEITKPAAPPVPGASPWTPLTNSPPFNPGAMILLSDGTLMVQDQGPSNNGSASWWRLTPDITGSYVNGVWTQLASIPSSFNYAPLYFASQLLPDGRVLIEGGEYNLGNSNPVWTNQGAIYDPVANSWTAVSPPDGGAGNWVRIGDAPSTLLADGAFMIGASGYSGTTNQALFDAATLTWTDTGAGKADGNGEEGWSLLPNGEVLTVDVDNPGAPSLTNSEIYNPNVGGGTWSTAGSTIVELYDSDHEIGPQVGIPTNSASGGTVYAFGASSHNAIFNLQSLTWTAAPNFPIYSGQQFYAIDAPAAVMPAGQAMVIAGTADYGEPVHALSFNGVKFAKLPDPPNALNLAAFYCFLIVLPNGEIMLNDRIGDVEVYKASTAKSWVWPVISSLSSTALAVGPTYTLNGKQLAGLDQGAAYGDDYQPFTNYPLVRITNKATKHVFYARTVNWSTSSVALLAAGSTEFTLPAGIETGASTLVVVANGIPSKPVNVTVSP
jgi:hypothetical protein